jgi:lipoate-protein ligase A
MTPPTWRFLDTGAADGTTNMALDEAIMRAVAAGRVPPTLRVYAWQPPCLSIGRFQALEQQVDVAACQHQGIDVVRRPSGGGAVLHDRELTYSLTAPEDDPRVVGSVVESYRQISAGLVQGLARLGVTAELAEPAGKRRQTSEVSETSEVLAEQSRGGSHAADSQAWEPAPLPNCDLLRSVQGSPVCFEAPSDYEVLVGGRKLVGSAQVRQGGVLLQHGSLLLDVDVPKLVAVFRWPAGLSPESKAASLTGRITALRIVLGREVSFAEVATALQAGFEQALDVRLVPGQVTHEEWETAAHLRQTKYTNPAWNARR